MRCNLEFTRGSLFVLAISDLSRSNRAHGSRGLVRVAVAQRPYLGARAGPGAASGVSLCGVWRSCDVVGGVAVYTRAGTINNINAVLYAGTR